jgi:hypothetical protein
VPRNRFAANPSLRKPPCSGSAFGRRRWSQSVRASVDLVRYPNGGRSERWRDLDVLAVADKRSHDDLPPRPGRERNRPYSSVGFAIVDDERLTSRIDKRNRVGGVAYPTIGMDAVFGGSHLKVRLLPMITTAARTSLRLDEQNTPHDERTCGCESRCRVNANRSLAVLTTRSVLEGVWFGLL